MVHRRSSNYRCPPVYRREDHFNQSTVSNIRNLLQTHLRTEDHSESVRQRLTSNPGFNSYEAFNSLDQNNDGSITHEEFKRMIQSRGFYVSDKEVQGLVAKIDNNKDGRISLHEFSSEIRPKSPQRH